MQPLKPGTLLEYTYDVYNEIYIFISYSEVREYEMLTNFYSITKGVFEGFYSKLGVEYFSRKNGGWKILYTPE